MATLNFLHIRRLTTWAVILACATIAAAIAGSGRAAEDDDPYIWLETDSPRTLAWVEKQNARTAAVLEKDPRYAEVLGDALALAEATDRIPVPRFLGGEIVNFWQDADHVRGVWRRTTLSDYGKAAPDWRTILDLDAVASDENANWVWKGADCEEPAERRCMIALSEGGGDAVRYREFDIASAEFIADGFRLPNGKQDIAWEDADTLLVAREWTRGDLTASGYPFIVKRVQRGQPLSEATEVFRGTAEDVGVGPFALDDGEGHHAVIIERSISFFETEYFIVTADGIDRLALPLKSDIEGLVDGQLIVALRQDFWPAANTGPLQGTLVSVDLDAAMSEPDNLVPTVIYAPGPRESFQNAGTTRDALVVTTLDNVRGRALLYRRETDGTWSRRTLPFPDNDAIDLVSTDLHGDTAFLEVSGFLQPSSLWQLDAKSGALSAVKSLPAKFDATGKTVEQFEATSNDGTKIPYFAVHPDDMKLDGSNPTILYAYGGFQLSETPFYSATMGKLWLEKGGVFALANIRGGGEFGPAWHEAALKTHRQRAFDDFAAVARDMITRGITSPRRLGIQGGSNGGLLMGVEFTQHPDMWRAVDIQVPLLDMLRYEQIDAGASWVGEYGSVSNPEERAFLASISPYANIERGVTYPEPFIWTTTEDDRVGPQHARKFAARLAEYDIPYLFYEVSEGGHGSGANLKESAHTRALEMIYFMRKLMD
jgi:prolyl oligopeptidase